MKKQEIKLSKIFIILIGVIISITFADNLLYAISAIVNIETEEVIYNSEVDLDITAVLPEDISAYEIRININTAAFEYVSTNFNDNYAISNISDINDKGILTLQGKSGNIKQGEHNLASIHLKAKQPGVATILIASSKFWDINDNEFAGSMLKYYSLEMNYTTKSNDNHNTTRQTASPIDTTNNEDNEDIDNGTLTSKNIVASTASSIFNSEKTIDTSTTSSNIENKVSNKESEKNSKHQDRNNDKQQRNNEISKTFNDINDSTTEPTSYKNIIYYIIIISLILIIMIILFLIFKNILQKRN